MWRNGDDLVGNCPSAFLLGTFITKTGPASYPSCFFTTLQFYFRLQLSTGNNTYTNMFRAQQNAFDDVVGKFPVAIDCLALEECGNLVMRKTAC